MMILFNKRECSNVRRWAGKGGIGCTTRLSKGAA
jgi:hypothetical protein